MTLASDIIKRAYRETNLLPLGQSPTTNQQTEGLELLNTLVASTVGLEIGDPLNEMNIGGTYDLSDRCSNWVPDDARLIFNITSAKTFNLDPHPYEGQRLSFVDVAGNLATYNVVLSGNGRRIEGSTSLTLNVNSDARQWLYRSDTGNWVKITSLIAGDTMPLPIEFDDYFITMLALRLNPRFSQQMTAETMNALKRARNYIRARYHNFRQIGSDVTTRGGLSDRPGTYGYPNIDNFNTGKPWPYL